MKKHWSDPDYGISSVESKGYYLMRLNALVDDKVKMINRTFSYSKYGGKENALDVVRDARNDTLLLPEVIAYLNHVYTAPKRLDIMVRRSRSTEKELTVPDLDGIHISTRVKKKGPGKEVLFFNAVALAPKGFAEGADRFRRSLRKYGIEKALTMVTSWRAERIGVAPPSPERIRKAAEYVENTLGEQIREQERLYQEEMTGQRLGF